MHSSLKIQVLCGLLSSLIPLSALAGKEGRVVSIRGEVNINGSLSKIGDLVFAGAKIETGSSAFVSILFGQESVMHISSDSQINVESVAGNKVQVQLEKGHVDGVKKISSKTVETITVRTPSAKYELTGGRFAVKRSGENVDGEKFLVLDGDGKITHLRNCSDGQLKAGDIQTVKSQTLFSLVPSSPSSDASSTIQTKKITEDQAQSFRPSVETLSSPTEKAQQLVNAITDPRVSLANNDRAPVSVENRNPPRGPGQDSFENERNPVRNLQPINHGQLPRDPGQSVPGQSEAAVSVIFQP